MAAPTQRLQDHALRAEKRQRIDVDVPAAHAEVQTCLWSAMRPSRLEQADDLTGSHRLVNVHRRRYRLVRRSQRPVADHHHPSSSNHPREGDPPRRHRKHRLEWVASQVNASMPGGPRLDRRLECPGHRRLGLQRPLPAALSLSGHSADWPDQADGRHCNHDKPGVGSPRTRRVHLPMVSPGHANEPAGFVTCEATSLQPMVVDGVPERFDLPARFHYTGVSDLIRRVDFARPPSQPRCGHVPRSRPRAQVT